MVVARSRSQCLIVPDTRAPDGRRPESLNEGQVLVGLREWPRPRADAGRQPAFLIAIRVDEIPLPRLERVAAISTAHAGHGFGRRRVDTAKAALDGEADEAPRVRQIRRPIDLGNHGDGAGKHGIDLEVPWHGGPLDRHEQADAGFA